MHIFITGATGWIGSAVAAELIDAGHQVTGLARNDANADALTAAGVIPHRGHLDDLDSLRAGAVNADGVIHFANLHDFTDPAKSGRIERNAIETFGDALRGTGKPLVIASGVAAVPGQLLTEQDASPFHGVDSMRGGSENLALEYADQGVRSIAVRFAPTVHGPGDHGFIAMLVQMAREKGVAGYVGDGSNRWPAVNRADAAELVRLLVEQAPPRTIAHAVDEEGVPTRDIAEAIGVGLDLPVVSVAPEDAAEHFGWLGMFFGRDVTASNAWTRERFGWVPKHPTLLEDLKGGAYFS